MGIVAQGLGRVEITRKRNDTLVIGVIWRRRERIELLSLQKASAFDSAGSFDDADDGDWVWWPGRA